MLDALPNILFGLSIKFPYFLFILVICIIPLSGKMHYTLYELQHQSSHHLDVHGLPINIAAVQPDKHRTKYGLARMSVIIWYIRKENINQPKVPQASLAGREPSERGEDLLQNQLPVFLIARKDLWTKDTIIYILI